MAAGDNFSAAIGADGILLAWGVNSSGQIGDSTTTQRTSPTVVGGASSVSAIALGDLHTLAVTPTGDVWSWGAGASGRLGDGGTANRPTPQAVVTGIADWAPAAPTIDLPSGALSAPQMVTITASTPGATIRYTLNGTAPTASDADVPAGGQVEIAYSSLLRARAFVSGRLPGAMGRAEYELQSAAPVISPPTGTYASAQTVTITETGVPGSIRFTLDGTEPSEASTLYSGSFVVSTTTTVKAKTFPSNGWTPSPSASATLTLNYGTLNTPVAAPDGGAFQQAPEVTLSSNAGASIRYTLDGTTPTESSTLYSGAFTLPAGGGELKARAFLADWTPSDVMSESYVIDTTAPTIVAQASPALLTTWIASDVTVAFTCSDANGVASCSGPVTISQEGAAQLLTGTAVDLAGNQATASLTVGVDLTAPTAEITQPTNWQTTGGPQITLAGTVADALSGLATARCNGVVATIVDGAVTCTVDLRPGRNSVVLQVSDVAGNSASAGVTVVRVGTATAQSLTPTNRTLLVNETTTLTLRDEFGVEVEEALWTSSDPAIVSVSTDAPPVLTALSPGTVTITAEKNSLRASASLTVLAGTSLAAGTTRWSSAGAPGQTVSASFPTNRVDLEVPPLFAVESNGTVTQVRAVTNEGQDEWVAAAPGTPIMADSFGGLVAGIDPQPFDSAYGTAFLPRFKGYAQFAGPSSTTPWRFDAIDSVGRPAQAPDGTIYAVERYYTGVNNPNGLAIVDTQVLVIDGATGVVRKRVPLARERQGLSCGATGSWQTVPAIEGPIVGTDGYGYLVVRTNITIRTGCTPYLVSQDVGLTLLKISPTGSVTPTTIYARHCDGVDITGCDEPPTIDQLFPDGIGGILVSFEQFDPVYQREKRLTRITDAGLQYDQAVDWDERITMVGDNGTAFVGGDAVRAMDVTNWTPKWTSTNPNLEPVIALPNGGVAMQDLGVGDLIEFNATGTAGESGAFGGRWGYQSGFGIWTSADSGLLTTRISLPLDEALTSFRFLGGVGTSQNAPGLRQGSESIAGAALAAFDFVYDFTNRTPWEWGGVICQQGTRYTFSRIVTNNDAGGVRTVEEPGLTQEQLNALPTCAPYAIGTPVGAFHLHTAQGQPYPSGFGPGGTIIPNDLNTAKLRPEITFFALTPGGPPPKRTNTFMYQAQQVPDGQGGVTWSAYNNTFIWVNSQWMLFTPPPQ
jgi:hypothetical protein